VICGSKPEISAVPNSILIHRAWTLTLSSLAAALLGSHSLAGPLNPPAGPVAPTPGPEPRIAINATNTPGDANSVFKITQPGSYYLTENINGVVGKHGIEIASSGVTLDLNGFDLAGVLGSLDGITAPSSNSAAIRNGSVRNWGGSGINLFGGIGALVTDIRARGNGAYGIRGSNRTVIKNCISDGNTGTGLRVAAGGIIEGCSASTNGADGIEVGGSTLVTGNICYANGQGTNGGAGIRATGGDNRIEGNSCTSGGRGIEVASSGNVIIKNTCGNNTLNWSIAANNVYGPIIDRSTPASAAVSGNSAADATGSSHPNANFTH
jgi:parallel beta-helix repeat protein